MIVDRVEELVAAAARGDAVGDDAFNRVALDVFASQVERHAIYRRLCEMRRRLPGHVDHWSRIPAVPADLFRDPLGDESAAAAVFLSSGTTQGAGRRSRHALGARSLALYRRSSMQHFAAMVLPDAPGPMSTLVLGPTAATHPSSSLGHMYSFVLDDFAARDDDALAPRQAFDADGAVDMDAAVEWLSAAASSTRPVLLLALTSTITALFEALRARRVELRLPAESRLVDTGGAKGGRTMSRAGILKAAWRFLHIPAYLCVAEYGMTELLSQWYDDALRSRWAGDFRPRAKVGPAWVRTLVVDPVTLEPVKRGERGILRHVDLAACEGVSAVQTLDIGVETGAGFEVLGRATGADARGCSQLMSVITAGGQA